MKIKFSHEYCKMPDNFKETFVVGVCVIENIDDLPRYFIDYDITYINPDGRTYGQYELKFKKALLITLYSCVANKLWTTIRRWILLKEKHYRSLIGKEVEIVIEEAGR